MDPQSNTKPKPNDVIRRTRKKPDVNKLVASGSVDLAEDDVGLVPPQGQPKAVAVNTSERRPSNTDTAARIEQQGAPPSGSDSETQVLLLLLLLCGTCYFS